MTDKFEERCKTNWKSAYKMLDYKMIEHHKRYKKFIESMPKKLVCQECGGAGSYVEPVLDYGEGPSFDCGFCEGTGYVTPHMRGQWLRWKREEKYKKKLTFSL